MYKVIKYSCSVRIENRVDEYDDVSNDYIDNDGDGYVY